MATKAVTVLVLILCFSLITSFPLLSLPVDGTACDWNVWDDTTEEKSVQKISIRCSEGQVTWRTPYGGLTITFLPPLKSQRFELCFVVQSVFATLQLFEEGNQTLNHLAVLNGSRLSQSHEICLNSTGDRPVMIFVETDSSSSSPVHGRMVLDYDVRAITLLSDDQMQECSPCSEEDILLAACTADYAVVGQIHSIFANNGSGKTDLRVAVSHVIRQRHRVVKDLLDVQNDPSHQLVFRHWQTDRHSLHDQHKIKDSSNPNRRISLPARSQFDQEIKANYNLLIVIPDKCKIRQGEGYFVFLGSIRLRKARLGCAPRMAEFERVWNSALATGSNPCIF